MVTSRLFQPSEPVRVGSSWVRSVELLSVRAIVLLILLSEISWILNARATSIYWTWSPMLFYVIECVSKPLTRILSRFPCDMSGPLSSKFWRLRYIIRAFCCKTWHGTDEIACSPVFRISRPITFLPVSAKLKRNTFLRATPLPLRPLPNGDHIHIRQTHWKIWGHIFQCVNSSYSVRRWRAWVWLIDFSDNLVLELDAGACVSSV